jgi:Flp pilus assembly protein TadD
MWLLVALGTLLAAGSVQAQDSVPAACREDAQGQVDFRACAEVAPKGSPLRSLSLINLATAAYVQNDYATAVRLYDEAVPPGQKVYSDASFHAFRGAAYEKVGRSREALEDARTALTLIRSPPENPQLRSPRDPEEILPNILPILKRASDPEFAGALTMYQAIPARDWISHANRAGVLQELGDLPGALAANGQAMKLQPDHPAVLNNACYMLALARRPAEGLPYCERAVAAAPDVAAVRHSYATALAALGRCAAAEAEMATARRIDGVSQAYREKLDCKAG